MIKEDRAIKKEEAAHITGYTAGTLAKFRYAGKLIEGVHYVAPNVRTVRYLETAIKHWATNSEEDHHKWLQERAQQGA